MAMNIFLQLIPGALGGMALLCACINSFWCESFAITEDETVRFSLWNRRAVETKQVGSNGQYTRQVESCVAISEDWGFDAPWKTARAFGVITILLGFFFCFVMILTPFTRRVMSRKKWGALAVLTATVLPVFQGLTFLALKSEVCEGCTWESGSTANVVSMVLWLAAGASMLILGAPGPSRPEPQLIQTVTYQQSTNKNGGTKVMEAAVVQDIA